MAVAVDASFYLESQMTQLKLPDIAAQTQKYTLPLSWVGMCGIALPVQFEGRTAAAKVDAGVSLVDGSSRGIHMSRFYLALESLEHQPLTPLAMRQLLADFLSSHDACLPLPTCKSASSIC